jgi:hypothetical protein
MANDLSRIRAEIKRREKAVNDKVRRVKSTVGVDVSGSTYDPRRDSKVTSRYNKAQSLAYLNKLNEFTDRRNQFIAGAQGVPLSKRDVGILVAKQNRLNMMVANRKAANWNLSLSGGMTVGEQETTFSNPNRKRARGEPTYKPLQISDIKAHQIKDGTALQTLIASVTAKLDPSYVPRALSKQRLSALKMADEIGSKEMRDGILALTDNQFDVLWNYVPNFARDLSHDYVMFTAMAMGSSEPYFQELISGHSDRNEGILADLKNARSFPQTR